MDAISTALNVLSTGSVRPPVTLELLPFSVYDTIFGFLSYKNVANLRLVSRSMNEKCGDYLTNSFRRIFYDVTIRHRALKAALPRRLSLRKAHPLGNDLKILGYVWGRLDILELVIGKGIFHKICCFFAGEILDETLHVLKYVGIDLIQDPYRLTEEIFDLTSMALEFYQTQIASRLSNRYLPLNVKQGNIPPRVKPTSTKCSGVRKVIKHLSMSLKRNGKFLRAKKKQLKKARSVIALSEKMLANVAQRIEASEEIRSGLSAKLALANQEIVACKATIEELKSNPHLLKRLA